MKNISSNIYAYTIHSLFHLMEEDSISSSGSKRLIWLSNNFSYQKIQGVLGPNLYDGMAGMALAYSSFYRLEKNLRTKEIAIKCILHSLHNANNIPETQRYGFYSGWPGIIYAASLISNQFNSKTILAEAINLMTKLENEKFSNEYDVMAGAAGAVCGLTLSSPLIGGPALKLAMNSAERLRLTSKELIKQKAVYWTVTKNGVPLTGFSHGNAGVGWALFELWNVCKIDWVYELASKALKFETIYFDPKSKNWKDLRFYSSFRTIKKLPPKSQIAWCHGAGGIALSRLRAFELTENHLYLTEIKDAVETLQKNIKETNVAKEIPSCLCHGITGNSDILLTLKRRLPISLDFNFSNPILKEHLVSFNKRISLQSIEPGLMLGSLGLANYLMRLIDRTIPSPLLPEIIKIK